MLVILSLNFSYSDSTLSLVHTSSLSIRVRTVIGRITSLYFHLT